MAVTMHCIIIPKQHACMWKWFVDAELECGEFLNNFWFIVYFEITTCHTWDLFSSRVFTAAPSTLYAQIHKLFNCLCHKFWYILFLASWMIKSHKTCTKAVGNAPNLFQILRHQFLPVCVKQRRSYAAGSKSAKLLCSKIKFVQL